MGPMGTHDGQLEYSPNDDLEPSLLAAREAFPDWDVYHAGHGYLAVPGGTAVFMASDVDALVRKLRSHQA